MRPLRVCIYGGTDLQGMNPGFVETLAREILRELPKSVIVTGGFKCSTRHPHAVSTDTSALEGARRYSEEAGVPLQNAFEACVPEPHLDNRPDVGGAVRMTKGDGVRLG